MIRFSESITSQQDIDVVVGENALSYLREIQNKKAIFYSSSVNIDFIKPHLEGEYTLVPIKDGEEAKDIQYSLELLKVLFDGGFDRGDYVIAIGGGSVTDTVGFIASTYMRGLNLINVPTTLLGMVDAGIGGKNGVNFGRIKNIIGTFYQPRAIIADLRFLISLPSEEVRKGLAEVIKYGLVLDKELYDFLALNKNSVLSKDPESLEYVVQRSIQDKLSVVKEDERETKGVRIVLNFGHTIGHAIEAGSGFSIPHGYAISVGMVCEAKIAEEMGYSEEGVVEDSVWILSHYNLPISIDELSSKIDLKEALFALSKDKKVRNGVLLMPFPTRIGDWKRVEVPIETLKGFAEQCLK
ncbi:3-dehydroquinate synthase [Sulfolobus acidocaldarius]|uniref:3-dehydroquinate synthase n=1 Tax=Sulfolobus acidocaldarius TaxID=2285 RepID=UPI00234BD779|nr:3-dehydroquinate synthase [Sulfolobus acidocaldarius]WCM34177.1 3-dehydroquinate synthase [Sulfolobus acidocaldarius DSM 639]